MEDRLIRGIDKEKQVRLFLIRNTHMLREMKTHHALSATVTAGAGRIMAAAAMMGHMLKSEQHKITLHFRGEGPVKNMMAVADTQGHVKAFAAEPQVELPLRPDGKLNVGGLLGQGELTVIKDLGLKDPYIGKTALVSGEIGEDLAYYFLNSEQQPSAVNLGVFVGKEGQVEASGGMILQVLPQASYETVEALEKAIYHMPPLSTLLQTMDFEEILAAFFDDFGFQIHGSILPSWRCDCSRERMSSALLSIGAKDLEEILNEDKKAEIVCHFCNRAYLFEEKDLRELLKEAKK